MLKAKENVEFNEVHISNRILAFLHLFCEVKLLHGAEAKSHSAIQQIP
jgi:hypothetical protein